MNSMTAWERWELASLDAEVPHANAGNGATTSADLDHKEIERICEEARQDGYEAGYAAGQGAVKAEAERLANAATNLDQAMTEFDQQVADELLALATEIARRVVRAEISARPEVILDVIHEALAELPHQHATIFLHPDDASLVRSHVGDALTHAGHRLLEEPKLRPGDCVLESGSSQLDGTVATRWRRVVETLGVASLWDEKDPS
jgi:flagellar assembly protein FliH